MENYEDKVVVEYLKYGWPLNFVSKLPPLSDLHNHKGARDHAHAVNAFIKNEVAYGRIFGPFVTPPFDTFFTSPLNTVPKSDSDERRVIVDLSWPIGRGVNSGIDV